jgi:hypothetical protein
MAHLHYVAADSFVGVVAISVVGEEPMADLSGVRSKKPTLPGEIDANCVSLRGDFIGDDYMRGRPSDRFECAYIVLSGE